MLESIIAVVRSQSHVQLFATPRTAARQAPLSFTVSWSLLKFMSIELMMLSNHLIPHHPLLFLLSISPSMRVFSNESAFHSRWPKNCSFSFSFSISTSGECWRLISFWIDWFDLFAVWGTLKSLFFSTSIGKHQFLGTQPLWFNGSSLISIHVYWKNHRFHYMELWWPFC